MARRAPVPPLPPEEDRLFVRDGRRVYRKTFSVAEVRAGAAVLLSLAAIAAWVAWRGGRPEPGLYGEGPELSRVGEASDGTSGIARTGGSEVAAGRPSPGAQPKVAPPFPPDIVPDGFEAAASSTYDPETMYVKIDGRADYYLSFGAKALHVLSLVDARDRERTVDLELFELASAASALGAYGGERGEARPTVVAGGLRHLARNALFGTHGRYYLRAIGSSEDAPMQALLGSLADRLFAALPTEELPWSYALFVGKLGADAGRISYERENAFSLDVARDVHIAQLTEDGPELFVVARASGEDAASHAAALAKGLLGYGEPVRGAAGATWIEDRYLHTFTGVTSRGPWVAGVRGAASVAAAQAELDRLTAALEGLEAPAPAAAVEVPAAAAGDAAGSAAHGAPEENGHDDAYN